MKFIALIFTLSLATNVFASDSCKTIQNTCNRIQAEYTEALQVWDSLDIKKTPQTIIAASEKWTNCLAIKEQKGCNKKVL
ncbi:MAG: hypothetical protein ACRBBP_02840 [Bdellovibrionales bacterium]